MAIALETLNTPQREAVTNYEGPSLIVAGAGSGKTRVLTYRIAYMLESGVPASQIMALTFTNKAAKEMRERITTLLPEGAAQYLWMGTFHSLFARILRAEAELLGYPTSYTIYDASDAKNLVKMTIKELDLDEEKYKPAAIASRISMAKNALVTPEMFAANPSLQAENRSMQIPRFVDIYQRYNQKCQQNGAMDFDDLLLKTYQLFASHPEVLARYRDRFRYLLVDEYQDTNNVQYQIIRALASDAGNVCVVGDDAQSIYSFRGAKIENILRFHHDYPHAQLFKLEQNYRSTQTIVNAANSVIARNQKQLQKNTFSKGAEGDKITLLRAYTDREEASRIAEEIATTVRQGGTSYAGVAILYRTNAQSRALEDALRGRSVPYRIYGGFSFYQRKEIKDLMGYIRLVVNPRDNEAFLRIINTPARGIGNVSIERITAAATSRGLSLWETISTLTPEEMALGGAAAKKIAVFVQMIGDLSAARHTMEAHTLGLEIATRSGLIGLYKMQQTPEAISALENIQELVNSISAYVEEQAREQELRGDSETGAISIDEWMQNVSLLTDADKQEEQDPNKVTLMTIHAAKGLEFEHVYITGLEENLFPSLMVLERPENLEEERRLFYVALTRAKSRAVLSFAETRFKWGEMTFSRPSRFLTEIDPSYLDGADLLDPQRQAAAPTDFQPKRDASNYRSGEPQRRGYGGGERRSAGGGATRYPKREPQAPERVAPISTKGRNLRSVSGGSAGGPSPASPQSTAISSRTLAPGECYNIGMRVEHARFGVGEIVAVEAWSNDTKLTVDFGAMGRKVLLQKFAKLHILS